MNFELRILSQSWISDEPDDRSDLCTHGKIYLRIGDNVITDTEFIDKSPTREFGDKFDKRMYSSFLKEFNSLRTRARKIHKEIKN